LGTPFNLKPAIAVASGGKLGKRSGKTAANPDNGSDLLQ
jgi:hypothetical protein